MYVKYKMNNEKQEFLDLIAPVSFAILLTNHLNLKLPVVLNKNLFILDKNYAYCMGKKGKQNYKENVY